MTHETDQELLETLIGRHLDGEITPAEQRRLDAVLQADPAAQALFERFRAIHERLERLATGQAEQSVPAETIIDRAMARRCGMGNWVVGWGRRYPFAAGLAAGLLIGVGLFLAGQRVGAGPGAIPSPSGGPAMAAATATDSTRPDLVSTPVETEPTRNIEWVSFTDDNGQEWVLEGYRYRRPSVRTCGL